MEQNLVYTTFWRRLGAYLLDALILMPVFGVAAYLSTQVRLFPVYYFLPGLAIALWYQVYLVAQKGATPGKLIMHMKIVKLDGSPVEFKEALMRYLPYLGFTLLTSAASMLAAMSFPADSFDSLGVMERMVAQQEYAPGWGKIGMWGMNLWLFASWIAMLSNPKRRTLNDMIAKTVVVRTTVTVPVAAPAPAALESSPNP